MSAEKIITALLLADAPLLALVPAVGIYPGVVPQGVALPALAVNHISGNPRNTLSSNETKVRRRVRIQVTVMAKGYVAQKALIEAVRRACQYQRGTVAGIPEVSVLPDLEGPDLRIDDPSIFMQTHDFIVSFNELR